MKYLFLLCFFWQDLACQAQYWAPLGAKWHFDASDEGGAPIGSEYYLYQAVSDTVILSKFCRKITVTHYTYWNGIQYLPNEYMYCDSNKVYYYRWSKFNLLYNFNAQAGDTLRIVDPIYSMSNPDTLSLITVDSVKTIIIGTDTLKVQYTTGDFSGLSYRDAVIERIGSINWMFPRPEFLPPEVDGPLRCYEDTSILFKPYIGNCDFWLTSSINEIANNENILLFPNPFTTTAIFQLKNISNADLDLIITNSLGQLIRTIKVKDRSTKIDRDGLVNGMYFYKLLDKNDIIATGKFIIE